MGRSLSSILILRKETVKHSQCGIKNFMTAIWWLFLCPSGLNISQSVFASYSGIYCKLVKLFEPYLRKFIFHLYSESSYFLLSFMKQISVTASLIIVSILFMGLQTPFSPFTNPFFLGCFLHVFHFKQFLYKIIIF